ncbi:response regulator [Pseudoalteromonas sp. SWYJZ98]|nr:response regulator [Pseudoalteromonas sp. SWYJZ98]
MSGIIGLTNILLEKGLPDEYEHYLDKIKYSSDQLLVVINDILNFSKIESGNVNLEEFPFSVNSVVDYIKATFNELAQSKGVTFDISIDEAVKLDLIGDVVRINQVLLNLCSNAIKFTPHGTVSVLIESRKLLDDPQSVCLYFTVKDSGIGIAEDNLSNLFESFTQADSSTTRKFGGTGLGLTISKRLCQLMGGDITVHSTQGVGSEFVASVEVKLNNQALIDDTANLIFTDPFDVLIIDDNEDDLKVIENQLTAMGLVCTACSSAKQAIDIIEQNKEKFKVIIVDWIMPAMSSETFLTRIYNINPQLCNNIIVLTRDHEVLLNDVANKININTILQKPVYSSVLYKEVSSRVLGFFNEVPKVNTVSEQSLAGIRVLVVEDNSINRLIVTNILENSGAQVYLVDNGLECIQTVKLESFDIILMDIHTPIMDGVEATQIIRNDSDETIANIPIIALTANVMKDDITRYLSIGMNAHVAKPIKTQKLRETIIRCLNK